MVLHSPPSHILPPPPPPIQVATAPFYGKEAWIAVARQGVRGTRLRVGTKKEVASALQANFASHVGGGSDVVR